MAIGTFLPWIIIRAPFVGQISKAGIEGDGLAVLILGAALAIFGVRYLRASPQRARAVIIPAVISVLALALTIFEFSDAADRFADIQASSDLISTSLGPGLYIIGLGSLAGIAGCLRLFRAARYEESSDAGGD